MGKYDWYIGCLGVFTITFLVTLALWFVGHIPARPIFLSYGFGLVFFLCITFFVAPADTRRSGLVLSFAYPYFAILYLIVRADQAGKVARIRGNNCQQPPEP
jgi:hypothetical protein